MRESQFAGTFYERGEKTLFDQITACFEDERGPGATPSLAQAAKKSPLPKAVIAPHAAYNYSGPCAAWSYKAIGDAPLADVYVILSPSHKGLSGTLQEPITTPLGIVRVDQDFARRLLEKGTIKENPAAFDGEHSMEVQLPFLQFAHYEQRERVKILPIMVGHDLDLQQLAVDIKETLVEMNKTVVFITSSDFTHYGRNFRFAPFSDRVQERIAELDKGAIDLIKAADHEGLIRYADETMATICGIAPIALLLRIIRFEDAHLEQYYTSAVITQDEKNSVSYASIVFN